MKILATKEYEQFKKVVGNRPIDINHVNYLIKLNSEENLLWQYPGAVTKDGYLTDGQHRLKACEINNWDFYYTVSDKNLEDLGDNIVALTNTAQKGWVIKNFINFYAEHGKEQYIFLQELMTDYKLTQPIIMQLISGKTGSKDIKLGKLKIYTTSQEKDVVLELINEYSVLRDTISSLILNDSRFAGAMRTVFKDFSAQEIVDNLARTPIKITHQRGIKDYLRVMEDVINYKKHEKNYIRFF